MRLIDADKLKAFYKHWEGEHYKQMFDDIIDRQETVEAVPIVRCKDCYWWEHKNNEIQGLCRLSKTHPTGKWYCADGMTEKNFEEYVDEVERRTIAETIELFTFRETAKREKEDVDTK